MSHHLHAPLLRSLAQIALAVTAVGGVVPVLDTVGVSAASLGQLQAQEMALQGQLQSLNGQEHQAATQAAAIQASINVTQQKLTAAQHQLSLANAMLANTDDRLGVTRAKMDRDRYQLALLVSQLYQHNAGNNLSAAIVDGGGVSGFMDTTIALQGFKQRFSALTVQVHADAERLAALRAQQKKQEQVVAAAVSHLASQQQQLQTQEANFTAQAASLSGQAAQVAAQAQQVSNQIILIEEQSISFAPGNAAAEEGTILAVCGLGSRNSACPVGSYYSGFPYGQCTWYVGTRTPVGWGGNAYQWITNAIYDGANIGYSPRVGSIVVFSRGGAYDYYYGHVAWVVQVLGPTRFIVDEANFLSGLQDEREISSLSGVEGFIYT